MGFIKNLTLYLQCFLILFYSFLIISTFMICIC